MDKLKSYSCPECGSFLEVDRYEDVFDCPFCGTHFNVLDFHRDEILGEARELIKNAQTALALEKYEYLLSIETDNFELLYEYACAVDGENRLTLADYELMPEFVVVDSDNMIGQSSEQISSAAMKALVHIMTALDSESATEYTDGFALKALENIIGYLPGFYENGSSDPLGCEKLAEASAMAGIAYANTCSFESCCKKAAAGLAEEMQRKSEADESVFARYVSYADAVGINADDEREKVNKLISKIRELTAIGSK